MECSVRRIPPRHNTLLAAIPVLATIAPGFLVPAGATPVMARIEFVQTKAYSLSSGLGA
jgi:hypothetical protein